MANRKELEKTLAEVGVELSDEKLGKVEKELEAKGELSLEELEAVAGGLSDTAKKNLKKAGIGALVVAGAGAAIYGGYKGVQYLQSAAGEEGYKKGFGAGYAQHQDEVGKSTIGQSDIVKGNIYWRASDNDNYNEQDGDSLFDRASVVDGQKTSRPISQGW